VFDGVTISWESRRYLQQKICQEYFLGSLILKNILDKLNKRG
jgi:hypothetical protein